MPIEVGIWKFDDGLKRVKMQSLDSESRLEDCLCADLSILSPGHLATFTCRSATLICTTGSASFLIRASVAIAINNRRCARSRTFSRCSTSM